MTGSRAVGVLALLSVMAAGPTAAQACARGVGIRNVGTQFQVTTTDRGKPAVGVQFVLRRGDYLCEGGGVLAKASTNDQGRAEFTAVPAGSVTLCMVGLDGHESSEWSLNVDTKFPSHANIETFAAGWNPFPIREAAGVIRVANYGPRPEGQGEMRVILADVATRKTLYETTSNSKGEFSFGETVSRGRYYLTFTDEQIKFMTGEIEVEVRPDGEYQSVNLDAEISDCGTSAIQREAEEPAKVTIACGQVFDSSKRPIVEEAVMLFDGGLHLVDRVLTDKLGTFQFSPQKPGHYLVYARHIAGLPGRREIEQLPVRANAACTTPYDWTWRSDMGPTDPGTRVTRIAALTFRSSV